MCSIQWFIIGYALAYGEGPGGVIGDLSYAFHRGVLAEPVGSIPAVLFSEFQLVFLATVSAISVGGACERGRILPLIPFIFVCMQNMVPKAGHTDNAYAALVDFCLLPSCSHGLGWWFPRRTWCA